jgi:Regulator of chromosome condensation (RCC1) repeat
MSRKTWKCLVVFSAALLQAGFGVGVLFAAAKSADKAITSFTLAGAAGTIDEKTITVDLAASLFSGIDALPAVFKTNGKSVRVGAKVQVSGKTVNDFTKPVVYTVTAADGSTQDYTVRVLVPKIVSISGYGGTMAVGSDGSLWGTGRNTDGQLGMGNTNSVYVPKQVLANGVASVSLGYYHSLILKTDGSLWAAGYNNNGELGIGNAPGVLSPVQIRRPSLAKGDE